MQASLNINLDRIGASHAKKLLLGAFRKNRDDTIRTCDPFVPSEVLYQTEPHPDLSIKFSILWAQLGRLNLTIASCTCSVSHIPVTFRLNLILYLTKIIVKTIACFYSLIDFAYTKQLIFYK